MQSRLRKLRCFLGDFLLEGETEGVGERNRESVSMSSLHTDGGNMQEVSATLTYILPPHAIVSVIPDARLPCALYTLRMQHRKKSYLLFYMLYKGQIC